METLTMLWPIVAAGLIVPTVNWCSEKLPGNFPIQPPFYAAVLSIASTWALAKWVAPTMTMQDIIGVALGTQVISQFFHAAWKTKQENTIPKRKDV